MSRHFLFFLLPLLAISCGEIELPQSDKADKTEQTTGKVDEGKTEDNSGDNNEDGQDKNEDEGTEEGNNDKPSQDQHFDRATITADGHLLIDDRLYISFYEFPDVPSAYSDSPTLALKYAQAYNEGDLKNWRIPTVEDVALLHDALAFIESPFYGNELLAIINQQLTKRGEPGIYRERYLCDDAKKTFSFSADSNVTKAAAKTLYRLRLVCDK